MGKAQRDKGNRGERHVVNMFKAAGFQDATRNYLDKMDGRGVDVTAGNFVVQVKNWQTAAPISKYTEIKGDGIKLLVTKLGGKWMAVLSLEDLLGILEDVGVAYKET